jgi:glycosyltransferase involved in cell wall biosynthesis
VDDASSDGTGQLAATALGDRGQVIRNEERIGPARARNRGIEAADGELVATLDADDLWAPEYLASQVAAYDAARNRGQRVALVCCDAELLGPGGPLGERWSDRVGLPDSVDLTGLLNENVVYNSVLVRRDVFIAHGGYSPELVWGEDYDLWLRLVEDGWEIVVNREPLATYRLRPDALSADTVRMTAATAHIYERALTRGNLDRAQRRLARRQRRLQCLLERRALLAQARADGRPQAIAELALVPRLARVALEHPERWKPWLRRGPREAAAGRHVELS